VHELVTISTDCINERFNYETKHTYYAQKLFSTIVWLVRLRRKTWYSRTGHR